MKPRGFSKHKKTPPPPPIAEDQADQVDPDDNEDDLPWEEDLRQWEMEERQDNEISRFVLYRRTLNNKGKEKVWEWTDEIPSSHEIGIKFGGGRYSAYLILPTIPGEKRSARLRLRHFILAESYTQEKRRMDVEAGHNPYAPIVAAAPVRNDMEMIAFVIREIVQPLTAGINRQPADPFASFKGFSDAMIEVTSASARSQIQLTRELQKELALGRPIEKEQEENAPAENEFKDFLKEVLKEYGPVIVEAGALKMRSIASQLKKDEVFQALNQDQNLFSRVLGLLRRDTDLDQGMAAKVLEKLSRMNIGMKIPLGVLTTVPEAATAPAGAPGSET